MKQLAFLLVLGSLMSADCQNEPTSDQIDREKQETTLREAQAEVGMPAMHNYQDKKMLKKIYELRDNEKIINYAYLFNEMQGKLIFLGKCLGYGLPYATQYSNPEKVVQSYSESYGTLPQAEPNGLFMPASAEGTWIMLLDKDGTPHPTYIEPRVIVSAFPLTSVSLTGQ